MKDRGILYFLVAGHKPEQTIMDVHGKLLIRSLESLKKHMEDIPAILYTNIENVEWGEYGFDDVIYKHSPDGS